MKILQLSFIFLLGFINPVVNTTDTLEVLGFSRDGKIAYLVNIGAEAGEGNTYVLFIQNLISDSLYVEKKINRDDGETTTRAVAMRRFAADIRSHRIVMAAATKRSFPANVGTNRLEAGVEHTKEEGNLGWAGVEGEGIRRVKVFVKQNGRNKFIRDRVFADVLPTSYYVSGFYKSPFEDKIAVLVSISYLGFEASTHRTFRIVGTRVGTNF